ncbi:alpha/beta hydrolase [Mycolicibacterium brumae]|uniref:Alpha/beta hydrolase n=2 Tax=Mycolicibacterium brumae TaxID=85968 RepID=A0A2G5P8L6_9MYCO|nr:alpha/beta hydrolase [Mycolicibacterium brumae]MCV7194184.1 alpha/beta hydrolase [Mycolicibacterium brumae]PIB74699.1 alpha/beta hydrolase [Mycolicibacterium brumae]
MGRVLSTLPGPAKQLLSGGRSVVIDGNTLDPSLQLFLNAYRLSGFQGLIVDGDVAASRRNLDDATVKYAGQRAAVAVAELTIPGPAGPIPARHYHPGDGELRALLVAYHGGGWTLGGLDGWDGFYRQICRESDVHVLSVDYRLAPEHPAPAAFEDAYAAYLWAVEHAAELGADPARVAVGGDSAGGNLAAVVAQAARDAGDPLPALQLLLYPITDQLATTRSRTLFGAGFLLTALDIAAFINYYLGASELDLEDPRVSPLRAADLAGLPPALVVTAGFDPLRDEGEAYAERMREAGVAVDLRRYRPMIHGFTNFNGFGGEVSRSIADITSALRAHLSRG